MPYYGESLPYYYGGPFANHSSLMTGAPRPFHTPLSRYSPHLSTITESPLSTLRRYSPVSMPSRPRRVIDTADIDVSTPRIHSQDANRQRNRLRRDRPTIKIRSQALKDNPALREHNERHEKSVGELLVEKFLIKDKKVEEAEKRLQLFHQISLDKEVDDGGDDDDDDDDDDEELQQIKSKITRRFTRRRSSADIQLGPEQIEREVAYAQVQAKVLDTLVAEEQAEIENEVRRGTLIKKGPKIVGGFFRAADGEPASQDEEEAAAQKMRKTLKKLKKKKKTSDKPSPPKNGDASTSSDVSVDVQTSENDDEEMRKYPLRPQAFKIEASNSVGDFSTIWVNSGPVEQFRESVKIPVPRRLAARRIERQVEEEESETEVVLPVKKPYIKDTSRNSVHFTVKTPPAQPFQSDPLKKLDAKSEKTKEPGTEKKIEETCSAETEEESNRANLKTLSKEIVVAKDWKEEKAEEWRSGATRKGKAAGPKETVEESATKRVEENSVTLDVDPLTSESSASRALPSAEERLPKASKINTVENNAVEVPKRSLREPEYLAKSTKLRDEDIAPTLPGKKVNKAATLRNTSVIEAPSVTGSLERAEKSPKRNNPLANASSSSDDAINKSATLLEDPARDTRKSAEQRADSGSVGGETEKVEDGEGNEVKDSAVEKIGKKGDAEASRSPFKVVTKKIEARANKEPRWRNKVSEVNSPASESSVPLNRSISGDFKPVVRVKEVKQSASVDENSTKMPVGKGAVNGESGSLSKSTSAESIDFWSEIKGPESRKVAKVARKGFSFANSKSSAPGQPVEDLGVDQLDKKKETDPKISVATPPAELSNIPVIEEKSSKSELRIGSFSPTINKSEPDKGDAALKKLSKKKKKNLSINIGHEEDAYSTVKKAPWKKDDSPNDSTPDTPVPASEVSTPIAMVPVPLFNIVEASMPTKSDSQILDEEEEDDEPKTPTNEDALPQISKWSNRNDLSNVDEAEKDVTPVPSSVTEAGPDSSKKKKIVRKKKASTSKKSSAKKDAGKDSKESKKSSCTTRENLKPPEKSSSKSSPKNTPAQRPLDLVRMFYTTPSALLTATPRDLSKVKRAKIKRKKHHSRTASMSSDSTGSTTSTATTESSGSTCAELDDDPEHKRMNSTRSNDSGFDGSPRISNCDMACHKKCEKLTGNLCGLNQKLVAEALQALKRAPSQSSDTQRNSDSSDHFPSGRITPPATNLPRFKKYAVTDFNFLKVLGKGSFGKVLLAELRGTECVYAVKCLKKDVVLEDDDVECTLIERKVLTLATRHPYLCHLFCTFQTDSHLFFVMEYLNGGDLMFHIQKSGRFPEPRARFYAAEIWSGLNFLHKKGIVYRDLKLDNVLLDFEGHIRIADFGMCKLQIFLDRTADTFCGTPDYMAPEIIKGLKYNQAVDWWSYGVLLYEMLTGQSPFSGCDEDELFWSICNERPFIPRYLSQDSTDILVALLEKDAGKRLPGHEIALHSFFQQLPWDRLERRQLEPPFKPALDHTLDTKYFDTAFTAERPRLTPVPEQILTSMDQGVFRGFSYTNPNATD